MRYLVILLGLLAMVLPLSAQEFVPPERRYASDGGIALGVFGFTSRLGVDFEGGNQAIVGTTVDVVQFFTDQLRLRPSFEIGIGDTATSYVGNLELIYRFTRDTERAVPYAGFGAGLWSQQRCAPALDCPALWIQFALGFEMALREHLSWLLEYHAQNGFRRHRFFIGLASRRGG